MTCQSGLVATFVHLNAGNPRVSPSRSLQPAAPSWTEAGRTGRQASLEERYSLRGLWVARPRWRAGHA